MSLQPKVVISSEDSCGEGQKPPQWKEGIRSIKYSRRGRKMDIEWITRVRL